MGASLSTVPTSRSSPTSGPSTKTRIPTRMRLRLQYRPASTAPTAKAAVTRAPARHGARDEASAIRPTRRWKTFSPRARASGPTDGAPPRRGPRGRCRRLLNTSASRTPAVIEAAREEDEDGGAPDHVERVPRCSANRYGIRSLAFPLASSAHDAAPGEQAHAEHGEEAAQRGGHARSGRSVTRTAAPRPA